MPLNIPQNEQDTNDKKGKRGKRKVKHDATWDGLTDKQKIEALRDAVLALIKAIDNGS